MTERKTRARAWKAFRKRHHFTQKALALVLGIGFRTVQSIEAGSVEASARTLLKFEALKRKYQQEKEFWRDFHEESKRTDDFGVTSSEEGTRDDVQRLVR